MKYKYKVCVYAICKNEEKNIKRWYESVKEADEIYVLDTGSTDNSIAELKKYGVFVTEKKINPWRFDVARNMALDLVPIDTDICVSIDLDEVFLPGWRNELEKYWQNDTTRARYKYNWKIENNKPVISFYYDKIHTRSNYKWIHPVHEILEYNGTEKVITCNNIILNHYPDIEKSRESYLNLLELSIKEDPLDDRNMHYLGREYMYHHRYNEAIDTLIKHLNLKKATWKDERAASMRFIARCYKSMNRFEEANIWYLKAINEAPYLRDGYIEYAIMKYELKDYLEVINYVTKALIIKNRPYTYINEIFSYDYTPYNLLSISYYYLGLYDISLYYINKAIDMDKDNEILQNNKRIIENTDDY